MVAVKTDKINGDALGTGRRKSSVARVRVRAGSGKVTINKRALEEYFPVSNDRRAIAEVLEAAGNREDIDIIINVKGGGPTGQSGACRMGIARAMVSFDDEIFPQMRDGGFLTRDARMKERKKPGLHGARRGTQFSKR
ncbi:MAG: 30S ribosomal protein S9 [Pirellulaceae bacterium]|nr:30S ribosomal protein S9 [Pirellulaceae bacterium]